MAVVDLTVNISSILGVDPTVQTGVAVGTVDQYEFLNDGRVILRVSDGAAVAAMSIISTAQIDGLSLEDRVVSIPSGEDRIIGPFRVDVYNDSERKVRITFGAADATLILQAFRLD